MASYTNDSVDKLRKQDLIPIVLSLQSKLDEANNEANKFWRRYVFYQIPLPN